MSPAPRRRGHRVSPGRPLRVAVVGLGRLGSACLRALAHEPDLTLQAVACRPARVSQPLPEGVPVAVTRCEAGTLGGVDVALLCVPADSLLDVARQVLSRGFPVVEASQVHGRAGREQREAIDREASRHGCAAVVGAGWDPGMLQLLRGWLALLVPKGHTQAHSRPAAALHHTTAARDLPGVRDALCTELREPDGTLRRYVYVEVESGVDATGVVAALRADPLFPDEQTRVIPVESIAALEEEGHGIVLERWGQAGGIDHQRLLFEARFDPVALTAQLMLAAARAVPDLESRAHDLADVPAARLFGVVSAAAREARD